MASLLPDMPTGTAIAKIRGEAASLLRVNSPVTRTTRALVNAGRHGCLALGRTRQEIEREIEKRRDIVFAQEPAPSGKNTKMKKEDRGANDVPEGYE